MTQAEQVVSLRSSLRALRHEYDDGFILKSMASLLAADKSGTNRDTWERESWARGILGTLESTE